MTAQETDRRYAEDQHAAAEWNYTLWEIENLPECEEQATGQTERAAASERMYVDARVPASPDDNAQRLYWPSMR